MRSGTRGLETPLRLTCRSRRAQEELSGSSSYGSRPSPGSILLIEEMRERLTRWNNAYLCRASNRKPILDASEHAFDCRAILVNTSETQFRHPTFRSTTLWPMRVVVPTRVFSNGVVWLEASESLEPMPARVDTPDVRFRLWNADLLTIWWGEYRSHAFRVVENSFRSRESHRRRGSPTTHLPE